jgi:replicative DNA helicase
MNGEQYGGHGQTSSLPMELPPHSIENERGVLGAILLNPVALLEVREVLPEAGAFYELRHQHLYQAILDMEDGGKPIDIVTLATWLREQGILQEAGGVPYLAGLPDACASAANGTYYAGIVSEKFRRRRKLGALTEGMLRISDESRELNESLDSVDALVMAPNDLGTRQVVAPMSALVGRAIDAVQRSYEHRNQGLMAGLATRFGYLDKQTGGIRPSELWIIGGRPGMGKTALICSVILNMSVVQQIPFGFLSMEMTADEIALRLLCALSGADMMHLRTGHLSQVDRDRLLDAAPRLASAPIFIDDTPSLTPAQVRSKSRRLVQIHGARILGIDHLHEVHVPEARGDERMQATEAGTAARDVAKIHKVPVIALAQLSRNFENEAAKSRGRRPRMTDLRGSGSLEQKADLIGILWHNRQGENEEEEPTEEDRVRPVSLEIVKQRNGPTGECRLTFLKSCLKYVDRYENTGSEEGLARRQRAQAQDEPMPGDYLEAPPEEL